jgi:hypothetical protein
MSPKADAAGKGRGPTSMTRFVVGSIRESVFEPAEDAGSADIHRYGRDCDTRAEPVASSAARRHRLYFVKPS